MTNQTERPPKPHADSDVKQLRIAHWYAKHNSCQLAVCLFVLCCLLIGTGVWTVVESDAIYTKDIRYDNIRNCKWGTTGSYSITFNSTTINAGCNAKRTFHLSKKLSQPIYIYYRLTNFHQNYRTYQISKDDQQWSGEEVAAGSDCKPFQFPGQMHTAGDVTADGQVYKSLVYAPCGTIPWSMFNDSLALYKVPDASLVDTNSLAIPGSATPVCVGGDFAADGTSLNSNNKCRKKGIAFRADRNERFKKVSGGNVWSGEGMVGSSDPYRAGGFYAFEPGHKIPITTDEDFIVWARTASMPDFYKLYRVIEEDLPEGDYLLDVAEHFYTTGFDGTKHFVLSTRTAIGGRNYVLGIALLVSAVATFIVMIGVIASHFCVQSSKTSSPTPA